MTDTLVGFGVSRGVVAGPVARMAPRPDLTAMLDSETGVGSEGALAALAHVAAGLRHRAETADPAAAAVLQAQELMALDPAIASAVREHTANGATAQRAVATAFGLFRTVLESAGAYMAERVADLDDVRDRAVAQILGLPMPGIPHRDAPFVLVAVDLSPADTAMLDADHVLGIVTEQGGPSSHTAILAKSLGIPAVVAVSTANVLVDDEVVLLDGTVGSVVRSPTHDEVEQAVAQSASAHALTLSASGPGRTSDGVGVKLMVNIGAPRDLDAAAETDSEGVGLFRTEFLFLDRPTAPTIEEQITTYRTVFDAFAGRRVVVRTLDAGADKPLMFVHHGEEPNPALGVRGYRTTRIDSRLLSDQLAAIAAAAADSTADVWVMAPMVSVPSEVRTFASEARRAGISSVGSMIEVPAAALRARQVLAECDFVSLGTNDLAQYTFAADRMLGALGDLLDPWQPGLLDLIRVATTAGALVGKPVGICGEAASDPTLALVLVGLGVRSLSMAPSAIPAVRTSLLAQTLARCEAIADAALASKSPEDARSAVAVLIDEGL
ncbi:phosphoenolpyruvate--protein phosphotransferase [Actinomycetes bacterium M1A6_2h]